jgi:competence protein ComEA
VPSPPPSALPPGAPVAPRRRDLRDRLPLALRAATVEPASRAVLGIALVLLLGLLVGVLLVWRGRPVSEPAPTVQRTQPSPSAVASSTAPPALVVHVTGAVRRPGLVQLPAPARVADALDAAGGPTRNAELTSVNLARPLVDGEQLLVLVKGQDPPVALPSDPRGPGTSPVHAPIDLNTATLEQLDTLPGVGPVLAQRIVDWRNEHGRFGSTEELREVSGIGAATFADLAPLVRV